MPSSDRSELMKLLGEMSSHATHQGTRPQSSQLPEPLLTDLGLKSGLVYMTMGWSPGQKKNVQAGINLLNLPSKSLHVRKKLPPPRTIKIISYIHTWNDLLFLFSQEILKIFQTFYPDSLWIRAPPTHTGYITSSYQSQWPWPDLEVTTGLAW